MTIGIILWSLAIGLLVVGLLRKNNDHGTDKKPENHGDNKKKHKGGCCG